MSDILSVKPVGHTADLRLDPRAPRPAVGRFRYTCDELSSDYAFFTHAAWFTYGGLDEQTQDPVFDWVCERADLDPDESRSLLLRDQFTHSVFKGLGGDRDRTLYGVRKDKLDSLLMYLCGVSAFDPGAGELTRSYYSVVTVPDPIAVETGRPALPVEVACVLPKGSGRGVVVRPGRVPRFEAVSGDAIVRGQAELVRRSGLSPLGESDNPASDVFLRQFGEMIGRLTNFAPVIDNPQDAQDRHEG